MQYEGRVGEATYILTDSQAEGGQFHTNDLILLKQRENEKRIKKKENFLLTRNPNTQTCAVLFVSGMRSFASLRRAYVIH